jgi:hypothetical protein
MNNNTIIQILLGFLLSCAIAMGGWSLKQHFSTGAKLAEMTVVLEQIAENTEWQKKQETTDRMHWKYLSWTHEHINRLYQIQNKELPQKPDLD